MKETPPVPEEVEFPPLIEVFKTDRKYDVFLGNIEDPIESYEGCSSSKRLGLFFIYNVLSLFCVAVTAVYFYPSGNIYLPLLAIVFITLAFFEGAK